MFTNPTALSTLFIGFIVGAILSTLLFFGGTDWLVSYLTNQWQSLIGTAAVLAIGLFLFVLFKKKIFYLVNNKTQADSLADITEKISTLATYCLNQNNSEIASGDDLKKSVRIITNYFVSTLVISNMIRYLIVLFGAY